MTSFATHEEEMESGVDRNFLMGAGSDAGNKKNAALACGV
jgi:hypothetical protein